MSDTKLKAAFFEFRLLKETVRDEVPYLYLANKNLFLIKFFT